MRVHAHPRYLLGESFTFFGRFFEVHPFLASLTVLGVYGIVLLILRRTFGEIQGETHVFAFIISSIVLLLGTAFYLYTHVPGFHFGG